MDFMSTVKGSLLEGFYPKGWDMKKIDRCCANKPADVVKPQPFWHKGFRPVPCADVQEFSCTHDLGYTTVSPALPCRRRVTKPVILMQKSTKM